MSRNDVEVLFGEDNYGIFQKTSEDNNRSDCIYFYSLDRGFNDAAFIDKIGKL